MGTTGELNHSILPDTSIESFENSASEGNTVSDGSGDHILPVPEL